MNENLFQHSLGRVVVSERQELTAYSQS